MKCSSDTLHAASSRLPMLFALAMATTLAGAEPPVVRNSPTHDELLMKRQQAARQVTSLKKPAADFKDPSLEQPKDLVSQSDVISYNGQATLVPKNSILSKPASFEARLKFNPGDKIVTWSEFYAANRAWITSVEITMEEAKGTKPLPESTTKQLSKSRNLLVTTFSGGPISTLPGAITLVANKP